jgi:hypothetical protein
LLSVMPLPTQAHAASYKVLVDDRRNQDMDRAIRMVLSRYPNARYLNASPLNADTFRVLVLIGNERLALIVNVRTGAIIEA